MAMDPGPGCDGSSNCNLSDTRARRVAGHGHLPAGPSRHPAWVARFPTRPAIHQARLFLRVAGLDRAFDEGTWAIAHDVPRHRLWNGDARRLWHRIEHPAVYRHSGHGPIDGGVHVWP